MSGENCKSNLIKHFDKKVRNLCQYKKKDFYLLENTQQSKKAKMMF